MGKGTGGSIEALISMWFGEGNVSGGRYKNRSEVELELVVVDGKGRGRGRISGGVAGRWRRRGSHQVEGEVEGEVGGAGKYYLLL